MKREIFTGFIIYNFIFRIVIGQLIERSLINLSLHHILTNRPSLIKRIVTRVNSIWDHCHILTEILPKPSVELPKFRRVRNWTECTVENLRVEVMASEPLQTLYTITDPQVIACTLSDELNRIIDKLAPPRRVQVDKNYQPYLTQDLREQIAHSNKLLTIAIQKGEKDDWCNYRNFRTGLNKQIHLSKSNYLNQQLRDPRKGWNTIKDFNGVSPQSTPRAIKHNGEYVRSPQKLSDLANQFYISKIKNLATSFQDKNRDPISLLSK